MLLSIIETVEDRGDCEGLEYGQGDVGIARRQGSHSARPEMGNWGAAINASAYRSLSAFIT